MGAADWLKFEMVCGAPSSKIRKLSFFRLGMNWPSLVVTSTSRLTSGTSTLIE